MADVRRRFPLYLSDFKDGLNFQCLAAIIFIAFAQICGSIAFGGLMCKFFGLEFELCGYSVLSFFFISQPRKRIIHWE